MRVWTAVAVLASMGVTAGDALAAFPGRDGQITIGRSDVQREGVDGGTIESGEQNYFENINPRNGARKRLPTCSTADCGIEDPVWSSSGTRLLFDRPETGLLMVTDANGANQKILGPEAFGAAWSPTGTQLVVSRRTGYRKGVALFIQDLATLASRRLTFVDDGSPRWSSKGWIAFTRVRGKTPRLCLIRPTGGHVRCLPGIGSAPDWSPDGRRLVYLGANDTIRTIDRHGRYEHLLGRRGFRPVWSPSGRFIAYANRGSIWVHDLRRGSDRSLARYGDRFQGMDWQPLP